MTSNTTPCVLRSYPNDDSVELLYDSCTIWEACRATSAATSFFDPIAIGPYGQKFADGAVMFNNPVQLVYREAETMWPDRAQDAIIISLGTGSAPSPALEGNIVKVSQALKDIVVQTESAADDFLSDHKRMADNGQLYRFNVYHGLGEIGLEEYKEKRRIADATHAYLTNGETRQRWRNCVQKLGDKEKSSTQSSRKVVTSVAQRLGLLVRVLTHFSRDFASCCGQYVTSSSTVRDKITSRIPSKTRFRTTTGFRFRAHTSTQS